MESPDCADQRFDGDFVKNKSAAARTELEPICNGHSGEEDSKKISLKRKATSPDAEGGGGGKKAQLKADDHGRGEIPAHHARRPPNGFLLFCKRHRDIVSAKNPNLENRGVTKLLGNWWRTLEEEDREKYKELARQNKEIFIANNPQFTWYKLPAPPLRTLVTRPSNKRPPKLEPSLISNAGPITPGKLADESQLGGLTSLLSSSLSPPTTPLNTSPPSPTAIIAPAPPKKRYLLQSRAKQAGEETNSFIESDEPINGNPKKNFKLTKKIYKKKKNWNSIKLKKNAKTNWSDSLAGTTFFGNEVDGPDPWKSESGCTKQQLIEKIVDSSFHTPKLYQDFNIQRTLDYINTEHTYQKNPDRFWQQQQQQQQQQQKQQKGEKRGEIEVPLQMIVKGEGTERNIISPNLNNNTIVLSEARPDGKNGLSYSFNDNNNLIVNYVDSNQRKLDQSSIQTNHDRIRTCKVEDGYIPGGKKRCAEETRENCDNSKRLKDQKTPFKIAQDDEIGENCDEKLSEVFEEEDEDEDGDGDGNDDNDNDEDDDVDEEDEEEIPKNCDKDNSADFQSILGKVSREIDSMIKERGTEYEEEMARFNVTSRCETDSDCSSYDKSDGSPPESPGGRRSKRSCKGQRYKQFMKDSVNKKRNKNSKMYIGIGEGAKKGGENRNKKRKSEQSDESESGKEDKLNAERDSKFLWKEEKVNAEKDSKVLSKEGEFSEKTIKEDPETSSQNSDDLNLKQGTKASDIILLKLDLESKESKLKRVGVEKIGKKNKDRNLVLKKKPMSKVQMIKEKRELHVGEFNLNEKIEELPLLSFESFLQKKRQRKKRLLGLKKEGIKSKVIKNKMEKLQGKSPNAPDYSSAARNRQTFSLGQSPSKPDFADLTTLAETALTLLSLREPR